MMPSVILSPLTAARLLLLLVVGAGIFFFYGFAVPVLSALVIGFASWPLFEKLRQKIGGNRTLAATIAVLCVLTFIVCPVAVAFSYAVSEIHNWFVWIVEANKAGAPLPKWVGQIPAAGPWIAQQWGLYVATPGGIGQLVQLVSGANIGNIYRGVIAAGGGAFHLVLTLLFMLFTLFFVFRDGEALARQADGIGERILPMRWARISRIIPATINSTVSGMTLIALGEGLVLGLAYFVAGAPSPVTLGVIRPFLRLSPAALLCPSRWCLHISWPAVPPLPEPRFLYGALSNCSLLTRR